MSSGRVATRSVATNPVATGLVALGGVATGRVAGSRVTDGPVAGAVVAGGCVAAAGLMVDGVGRAGSAAARGAETGVVTGVSEREWAGEGSEEAGVVVFPDGMLELAAAPAEFHSPASAVTAEPTRAERPGGLGDGACAGAAGVATRTSCWPGVAEPLARGPRRGVNNPADVVGLAITLGRLREGRSESTAVRFRSTRLGVPTSDLELAPIGTGAAEAPFDSVGRPIVRATRAFAQTRESNTLAVAISPKN